MAGLTPPLTYDIIVGDFGRQASIDYLGLLTSLEKERQLLATGRDGHEFFDESRRIMFVLCCEIEWFKRGAIRRLLADEGRLDERILIGFGPDEVGREFIAQAAVTIRQQLATAVERGYEYIRIYAPCNGLSNHVHRAAVKAYREVFGAAADGLLERRVAETSDGGVKVRVASVPEAAADQARATGGVDSVLILGTRLVQEIYRKALGRRGVQVFEVLETEMPPIADAITAAIAGHDARIDRAVREIRDGVVNRYRSAVAVPHIIEACTDFKLGLGKSSLVSFAEEMVRDVYG